MRVRAKQGILWVVAIAAVASLGLWTHSRLQPYGETAPAPAPVQPTTPAPAPQPARPANPPEPLAKPKPTPKPTPPRLAKPPPSIPTDAPKVSPQLQTAAAELSTLYTNFDADTLRRLFAKPPPPEVLQEMLDWYQSVLGTCGAPVPLIARDEARARFLFPCEQGQWEAEIDIDAQGKIKRLRQGARGVDPEVAVLQAAEKVMSLLIKWDDQVFKETFGDAFSGEKMRPFFLDFTAKWGPCELDDIDLANTRGALIDLACKNGPRMMKIDLHHGEDRIRIFRLAAPRPTPWD